MVREARVIYWNHLTVWLECPNCSRIHHHEFPGITTYPRSDRSESSSYCCEKKAAPLLDRMYMLQWPTSWWIDKGNGLYVSSSYRGPRIRDARLPEPQSSFPWTARFAAGEATHLLDRDYQVHNGRPEEYKLVRHGSSVVAHGPLQLLETNDEDQAVAVLLRPLSFELLHSKAGPSRVWEACYISGDKWAYRAKLIAQMIGHELPSGFENHAEKQLVAGFLSMHTWDDVPSPEKLDLLKKDETQLLQRYDNAVKRPFDDDNAGESLDLLREEIRAKKNMIKDVESMINGLKPPYSDAHIAFFKKMRTIEPSGRLKEATILVSSGEDDPCFDCLRFIEKVNSFFGVNLSAWDRTWPPRPPSMTPGQHTPEAAPPAYEQSSEQPQSQTIESQSLMGVRTVDLPGGITRTLPGTQHQFIPERYRNLQARVEDADDSEDEEYNALPGSFR